MLFLYRTVVEIQGAQGGKVMTDIQIDTAGVGRTSQIILMIVVTAEAVVVGEVGAVTIVTMMTTVAPPPPTENIVAAAAVIGIGLILLRQIVTKTEDVIGPDLALDLHIIRGTEIHTGLLHVELEM